MAVMISSCAAQRFCAQRVPRLLARRSASAPARASASTCRRWARICARALGDLAGSSPIKASRSARIVSAVLSAKRAFLGRTSASASVITDFLQLVQGLDRLSRRHLVGAYCIEGFVNGVLTLGRGRRLMGKERQIV